MAGIQNESNYPKRVFFILGSEFFEKFSFYGIKTILAIYLSRALLYDDNDVTAIYHGFNMSCYVAPILGAILADGYIGKFKAIIVTSLFYFVGYVINAFSGISFAGFGHYHAWLCFIGLFLIAIGTGSLRSCLGTFGADQFEDTQTKQKEQFFGMFYMSVNMGSLLAMIIIPIVRSEVICYGDNCYALAFGIPASFTFIGMLLFISGSKCYTKYPPGNNIIGRSVKCICIAIIKKIKSRKEKEEENIYSHWLYHASHKYDTNFIEDIKRVLAVCFMFITFPIYWALYEQQGSRWVLQAGQMNGDIGISKLELEPDNMVALNPLFVLILVPICEYIIFPLMDKLRIPNEPSHRIAVGMLLAVLSFTLTGFVQVVVDNSQPKVVPEGSANIQIINASPCEIKGILNELNNAYTVQESSDTYTVPYGMNSVTINVHAGDTILKIETSRCFNESKEVSLSKTFRFDKEHAYNLIVTYHSSKLNVEIFEQKQMKRTGNGKSNVILYNMLPYNIEMKLESKVIHKYFKRNMSKLSSYESMSLRPYVYDISYRQTDSDSKEFIKMGNIKAEAGGLNSIVLQKNDHFEPIIVIHEDISSNSVSILLQLPQFVIMALSEVFFFVSAMTFAYSQAPATMKALLQALYLLTITAGNLLIVIAAGISPVKQVYEFFFFAVLMIITTLLYIWMMRNYEYVDSDFVTNQKMSDCKGITSNDSEDFQSTSFIGKIE